MTVFALSCVGVLGDLVGERGAALRPRGALWKSWFLNEPDVKTH